MIAAHGELSGKEQVVVDSRDALVQRKHEIDKAGAGIATLIFDNEGHFDVIDPASPSWEATLAYLAGI